MNMEVITIKNIKEMDLKKKDFTEIKRKFDKDETAKISGIIKTMKQMYMDEFNMISEFMDEDYKFDIKNKKMVFEGLWELDAAEDEKN